ncbi:hypothetical protein NA57DRAFT_52051 [Rhizodiscina lignyota]|uniref:Uncharacterized protein n=1 Tax=Rhizodiscina lignyota TaxID=1504668 RepID=A0A9P4MCI3_9PEZI|nr:hypothetical protein NA57DRAFT_52051 [Rhizodiscina lignyota]
MLVDTISSIGEVTTADHDIITVINSIHTLIDDIGQYPTGETKGELKLKVPIGNAMAPCVDGSAPFQIATLEEDEEDNVFDWNSAVVHIDSVQDMIDFLKQNGDVRALGWKYWYTAAAFMKRISNGRYCATVNGFIGVALNEVKGGDKICVFQGAVVPFVVRPASASTYRFVGECYIHGIMYGETSEIEGVRRRELILE